MVKLSMLLMLCAFSCALGMSDSRSRKGKEVMSTSSEAEEALLDYAYGAVSDTLRSAKAICLANLIQVLYQLEKEASFNSDRSIEYSEHDEVVRMQDEIRQEKLAFPIYAKLMCSNDVKAARKEMSHADAKSIYDLVYGDEETQKIAAHRIRATYKRDCKFLEETLARGNRPKGYGILPPY